MFYRLPAAGPTAGMDSCVRRSASRAVVVGLFALLVACGGGETNDTAQSETQAPVAAGAKDGRERDLAFGVGDTTDAPSIGVKAMIPVGLRRLTWNNYEYDYRIVLQNSGPTVEGVKVELVSPPPGIQIIDGTVDVGTLAGGKVSMPTDTITIRKPLLNFFILRTHEWRVTLGLPRIDGVAAVGAALANANVLVTDTTGTNACAQGSIVTSGTGAFSCSVLAGRSAPFVITVSDPSGAYPPMVSVATTMPEGGTTLVANVTPLTTAIAAQLAPNGDPLSLRANPALVDAAALATVTSQVLRQLAQVLSAIGAPADYNPFTTQIVAGSLTQGGNTADQVIEVLRFTTVNGVTYVSTVDNAAGAVPLATATTTPPTLPAPTPALLSLQDSLRLVVNRLGDCFALPVSTRVLAVDMSIPANQGGPSVTSVAPACQEIAHPDYLTNGYRFGQRFYRLLSDATMVGASFSPAEITLFVDDTTAADSDFAIVNIRYVAANGIVGNFMESVRKLPGSATATHPSDWWPYGNRQPVDSTIRSFIRLNIQRAPNPGTAPFADASASRFESGIELYVNKDGPGSAGMRAARITGPGLPPAGVVLTRPDPAIITDQTWLNVRRKDGLTDPASATFAGNVGDIFRLQRTEGIDGAAATTVRPNPNAQNADNTQFPNWAHPLDFGLPPGTANFIDFATLKAQDVYTIEIYYDGEVVPRHTFTKRRATAIIPATYAVNLRWLSLTPGTLGYLTPGDPLAASQASMALSWNADPFAETIDSVGVFASGAGQSVADSLVPVGPGATGATAVAPASAVFPALTGDGTSGRSILLRYRMLDGSYKDSSIRFN